MNQLLLLCVARKKFGHDFLFLSGRIHSRNISQLHSFYIPPDLMASAYLS